MLKKRGYSDAKSLKNKIKEVQSKISNEIIQEKKISEYETEILKIKEINKNLKILIKGEKILHNNISIDKIIKYRTNEHELKKKK